MHFARGLLVLGLLAGCAGSPDPAPISSGPALSLADVGAAGDIVDAPTDAPLVVTTDGIARGDAQRVLTLEGGHFRAADVRGGEHGYYVEALTASVATTEGRALAIAFDPAIPYLTVTRVLYTAGQSGVPDLVLLVTAGARRGALPIHLPRVSDSSALADVLAGGAVVADDQPIAAPTAGEVEERELNLTVQIDRSGLFVAGAGGRLAPNCQDLATAGAPTIPARAGEPDLGAFAACLGRLKREFPNETQVIVSADPATRFEVVARVLATARGSATAPLFPDTALSITTR